VELQHVWPELQSAGIAVFGLSYDSVDVLASFAEKRGITFPLLSDEGSRTIRDLGLLNQHVVEQHAYYGVQVRDEHYGVPYPGTLVLDENGIVVAKHFDQSYRVRPTAALFHDIALGSPGEHPSPVTSADPELTIQTWTDTPTYRPYQQLRLHVQIDMLPGTHIFAATVPADYTPLQVEVDPMSDLTVGATEAPPGHPSSVQGVDDELTVYTDTVRATVPLLITKNLGPTELGVRVIYQSCTETVCNPPRTAHLTVSVQGLDLIRD
jgi:peroxiredoxin